MQYGTVTGRFLAVVADTTSDADEDPDLVPITGKVLFTPSMSSTVSSTEGATILPTPITADIDAEGYVSLNGVRGVRLVASDSEGLNPTGFTYLVTFPELKYGSKSVAYKSFPLNLPAGSTVDLAAVAPVGISNGVTILRGEKGDPGPAGPRGLDGAASTVPGPQGPKGDTGATGPAGAASTVPGPKGDTGATGATGPAGADSTVPGPQGPKGDTGAQGIQGIQGPKGDTGATGPAGPAATNPVTSVAGRTGDVTLTKSDVGLANAVESTTFGNTTVFSKNSSGVVGGLTYGTTATASALVLRGASGQVTVPASPSSSTDAVAKSYADTTGDQVTSSVNSATTGTVALPSGASSTVRYTLTGATTFTMAAGSSNRSYSVTAILVQDGTGSRTVTWPSSVKFAGGTKPTISTAAGAIDVVTLLWTGTEWLGFAGGTAFA